MIPTANTSKILTEYWQRCQRALPELAAVPASAVQAWGFGNTPEMADELGALVVAGIKTATASLLWSYEDESEPLPKVGQLSIILNGRGEPLGLIRTEEIRIVPFNEVDAKFASDEGEGDRTLAYWRKVHWDFFTKTCPAGKTLSDTMPIVCERFRLLYP